MKTLFTLLTLAITLVSSYSTPVFAVQTQTDIDLSRQQMVANDGGMGSGNPADTGSSLSGSQGSNGIFQIVSCSGVDDPRTPDKKEVECDFNQIIITIGRIIKYVLYLIVPALIGMILYVGWMYLTSNGETVKLEKAKSMIQAIAIGVLLIFSAYIIVYKFILQNLLADRIGDINKSDIINTGGN